MPLLGHSCGPEVDDPTTHRCGICPKLPDGQRPQHYGNQHTAGDWTAGGTPAPWAWLTPTSADGNRALAGAAIREAGRHAVAIAAAGAVDDVLDTTRTRAFT